MRPSPENRPGLPEAPVELTTDLTSYPPDAPGVLGIQNRSDDEFTHGVCPSWEREQGSRWVSADRPDAVCIMIAVILKPRGTGRLDFTTPTETGVYRLRLDLNRFAPTNGVNGALTQVSNTFQVRR